MKKCLEDPSRQARKVFRKIWMVTGHYGSGKTEFSVNFAIALKKEGRRVAVVDLDIVNPYFRSREQKKTLEDMGIRVASSNVADGIDLPALSSEIYGLLQNPECDVIFDVGGDDAGARVLGRFFHEIPREAARMLFVLNVNRPKTADVASARRYIEEIEAASRQKMYGIVNNTHLCEYTSEETIILGDAVARELSKAAGIPILYYTVEKSLSQTMKYEASGQRIVIDRYMKKPWE